jgi:hypothetical protein
MARLAGRREIADTTISIPHPYSEEQARQWIAGHADLFAKGKFSVFGMELKQQRTLAGTVGLREIDAEHSQAELGFWIAVELWGQGCATEAAREVVSFGFEQLGLNRFGPRAGQDRDEARGRAAAAGEKVGGVRGRRAAGRVAERLAAQVTLGTERACPQAQQSPTAAKPAAKATPPGRSEAAAPEDRRAPAPCARSKVHV